MVFSYNWLQEYIAQKLSSPQKLAGCLNMHAFEIEEFKQNGDDWMFDVKILPHRPDAMSHVGLAREVAAICGKSLRLPKTATIKPSKGMLAKLNITVADPAFVPRYSAIVIEGIVIKESPDWLKKKLNALGINSINNIVDITNFVMCELGQPLHAFDYDKIQGHSMHVRPAKAGEKILSLDDHTFTLPEGAIIIEDSGRVIDLAGIKGGKLSGIDQTSKNVILEAANFHGKTIYKTKKFIQYTTPAADLFSHNLDPEATEGALERAWRLAADLCGGKLVQYVDLYPKKRAKTSIVLEASLAEKLLGVAIPASAAKHILKSLGCETVIKKSGANATLTVTPPFSRRDLAIPEDIVEEIGRIHGYENIEATFPKAEIRLAPENSRLLLQETARNLLAGAGMTETYNYSFVGEKDLERLCYTSAEKRRLTELANPLSEDVKYLRSSLLDNLVKNVAANQKMFSKESLAFFETGNVFFAADGEQSIRAPLEAGRVAGILAKISAKQNESFFELKGIIEYLAEGLGIADVEFKELRGASSRERLSFWREGTVAEIAARGRVLGSVGEVSPFVLSRHKISRGVAAFQLDTDELAKLATKEKIYEAPAKFPGISRDISLFVPKETKAADALAAIKKQGGEFLRSVELFDVFEGGALTREKKSFAFRLLYQSDKRTLTNQEIDEAHETALKELRTQEGWEIR